MKENLTTALCCLRLSLVLPARRCRQWDRDAFSDPHLFGPLPTTYFPAYFAPRTWRAHAHCAGREHPLLPLAGAENLLRPVATPFPPPPPFCECMPLRLSFCFVAFSRDDNNTEATGHPHKNMGFCRFLFTWAGGDVHGAPHEAGIISKRPGRSQVHASQIDLPARISLRMRSLSHIPKGSVLNEIYLISLKCRRSLWLQDNRLNEA